MAAVIHPDDIVVMKENLQEQLKCGNTIHNETEQKMQEIRGLTLYTVVKNIYILKYRTNIRICSVLF